MSIFEMIAESNIKKWLKEPKSIAKKHGTEIKSKEKTFEGHLLDEIKGLIEAASTLKEEERKVFLTKANGLQIQLLVGLERSGHFMLARKTELILLKHKMKFL